MNKNACLVLSIFVILSITFFSAAIAQSVIVWELPTPDDGQVFTEQDWVYLNTTITGTDTSAFFDWDHSLVGYWSMDFYNSSGVYDNSTYDNFGTFQGGLHTDNITTGKYGQGLEFDGSSDYINISKGYGSDSVSATTVCSWVKSTDPSSAFIISFDRSEVWRLALVDDAGTQNVGWDTTDSTGTLNDLGSLTSYADGNWHYICGWFEAGASPDKKIFIDGVLVNSTTAHNGNNLGEGVERTITYGCIGGNMEGVCNPNFNGVIDEIKIWNRALSPEEINASYNNNLYRLEHNFTNLNEGIYDYSAYAIDSAGNLNIMDYRQVTVDQTQPILSWEPPTPDDDSTINRDWVYLNTTITDTDTSAFFDWDHSLVGYWSMDFYNSSGVFDNSTHNNFGTFGGGISTSDLTTGKYGNALEFDGSSDYVNLGTNNIPANNASQSISVWAWYSSTPSGNQNLIALGNADAFSATQLGFRNNVAIAWKYGGVTLVSSGITPSSNNWHHYTYIFNGINHTIYIDGIQRGTTTNTPQTAIPNDVEIGRWVVGTEYFSGIIDEVRIYSRALSPEEINASFNNGAYRLKNNFTSLSDGIYDYSAYAIDSAGNLNIMDYRQVTVDQTQPILSWELPTPDDGQVFTEQDWVYVNVSSDEVLSSCILDWGGTNESVIPDSNLCYINKTGLGIGDITYIMYGLDYAGNMNSTGVRKFSIPDLTLPVIDKHEILPRLVPFGEPVLIGVNASDDEEITNVQANITSPDGDYYIVPLTNNELVSWNTREIGTYTITIFAEDATPNSVNVTDTFYVNNLVELDIEILDSSNKGVSTNFEIYMAGTTQKVFSSYKSDGKFELSLVEHDYDMLFLAFSDQFELFMEDVSLTSGFGSSISLDNPSATEEFEYIFVVETDYSMSNALITIYYNSMDISNESNINIYRCDDWDFYYQKCDSDWESIENITVDMNSNLVEFKTNSFSAFALREDSYCGDAWCGPTETTDNCPEDCQCNEGESRLCSVARYGICSVGTETCHNNAWSGCPAPIIEICNRRDDDCDGITDNVDGGDSVEQTKCQCYNGGVPAAETCNGIDDDCDGRIDVGADCCIDGQTRECGTDKGVCEFGISTCSGGIWGSCVNAITPQTEICDGLDNNCDGEIDENCDASLCGEGKINATCMCGGSIESSGYCCSGVHSSEECTGSMWWILIAVGVIMLVVLVVLIFYFKSRGRELTWKELTRKYTRLLMQ